MHGPINNKITVICLLGTFSQNCKKQLLASSFLSVCLSVSPSSWNNSALTGRIFVKFDFWAFFFSEICHEKLKFHYYLTWIMRYFTWRPIYVYDIWLISPYSLTPRCRVLLEQPTGLQLVKKFPAFHGTRRFITALTSVRQFALEWEFVRQNYREKKHAFYIQ